MKIALGLILMLVPWFSSGQDKPGSILPRILSPMHIADEAAHSSPTPRAKSQAVSMSDLEVILPSTLSLDPACNACKGVSIALPVHNKSPRKITLALAAGDAVSIQGEKAFNATVTLVPLNDQGDEDSGITALAGGKNLKIKATVVGTLGQGAWEVSLLNQGKLFGKFKVQNPSVAFDVKPEIVDSTNPELKFRLGEPTLINIKNDDTLSYRIECLYTIGKFPVPCEPQKPDSEFPGTSKVGSKDSARVFVNPDPEWFSTHQSGRWDTAGAALHSLRGLLSDYMAEGQLTIRLRSSNCTSDPAAPVRTFKFKTRLAMHSEEATQIAGFVVVFLVLLGGALLSVLANLLLPAAARRLKVKEALAICARKISDLSLNLDSRLRVPLGVERARLSRRLEEQNTVSPDFTIAIAEIEKDVAGLKTRVDILENMELLVRRFWKMRREARLPVSLVEGIDDIRQQATDILARSEPKDTDLQNAQLLIQEIEKRITTIDQPNLTFAQQLVSRLQKLKKDISLETASASATPGELPRNLSDRFDKLLNAELPKPEEISPADYVDLDGLVLRMAIVDRYNALVRSPVNDTQRARLTEHHNRLQHFLRQAGSESLYQARSLIQQLEENIFPEDVTQAMADHQVRIEPDRNVVYQFESASFHLLFLNRAVDKSTARRECMVKWDFGDGLSERGGWVSHYFADPTIVGALLPWAAIIRRLLIALVLAYGITGLPLAWWFLSRPMSHFWAALWSGIIVVALITVVISLSPLAHRFRLTLRKKRNPNLPVRETDPKFLRPAYELKASLTTPDGIESLPVSDTLEVYKMQHTRIPATFWVEVTRIAIALLIALAGLVAGAKEQLLKLDFFPALVAIFLIGFGANEVKKLFSQNPQA